MKNIEDKIKKFKSSTDLEKAKLILELLSNNIVDAVIDEGIIFIQTKTGTIYLLKGWLKEDEQG